MFTLYGIPNCDTVKKSRDFLAYQGLEFAFVDFKKTPPTAADLERWRAAFGDWPVNKKGTTYKKFKDEFEAMSDQARLRLLQQQPSMLKRPILERDGRVLSFGLITSLP